MRALADELPLQGNMLSRDDATNAFRDFTFVYAETCNGDLHGGDAVVHYQSPSLTVHHKGHANIVAFLNRVAATWPDPARVAVAGLSAGGYGTLINYDTFRLYWPSQEMYLIDDSGPALAGLAFPAMLPSYDSFSLWNVQEALAEICPDCSADFSSIYSALARWYPNDRKSLVSHLHDPTIEEFDGLASSTFSAALRTTASQVLQPNRWKWFYSTTAAHTFFFDLEGNASVAGVPLRTFYQEQLDDIPSWSPVSSSP